MHGGVQRSGSAIACGRPIHGGISQLELSRLTELCRSPSENIWGYSSSLIDASQEQRNVTEGWFIYVDELVEKNAKSLVKSSSDRRMGRNPALVIAERHPNALQVRYCRRSGRIRLLLPRVEVCVE